MILHQTVALSLAELTSLYPTASGPYYWTYQLLVSANQSRSTVAVVLSYISGWLMLLSNWIVCLSINFGFASILSAVITLHTDGLQLQPWHQLLIFYALCLVSLAIVILWNKFLPTLDTIATVWNLATLIIFLIALSASAKSGRQSTSHALGYYDDSLSGWGGFSFFIGMLPPAYTFCAIGLICSMAEEVDKPAIKVPTAMSIIIPISTIAGLMFILPICVTMPPLEEILLAPGGQALPYIIYHVMSTAAGSAALNALLLITVFFCSTAVTVPASRYTYAFARDNAMPGAALWSKIHPNLGVPVNALYLMTAFQMLLGLISLGSSTAFTAFVSMTTIALQVSYGIPIAISMWYRRSNVKQAQWKLPNIVGWIVNTIAIIWISFECVLFSMPVTMAISSPEEMNYASVVLIGLGILVTVWYLLHARKGKVTFLTTYF
jgi:amino acid transporter